MSLLIATDDGIRTVRLTPVRPFERVRLEAAPKLVVLPTASDVLLPFVTERFCVVPFSGAVTVIPAWVI
ncbi:hypothetical protein KR49_13950 [Synechococcus sp. KORDI-49]|nr:hypothetical protein KR49_13950 [Synechococcus sp. KORDI-49]